MNKEKREVKTYRGEAIDVTYDYLRCTHAAECVRLLPDVFNTSKRPRVAADNAR